MILKSKRFRSWRRLKTVYRMRDLATAVFKTKRLCTVIILKLLLLQPMRVVAYSTADRPTEKTGRQTLCSSRIAISGW